MRPRYNTQALLALGLFCLTLTLLTLRLLAPPARTIDVGGPGDAYSTTSFYAPEVSGGASFRWSGPNSTLVLPAHTAGGALLRMRAHGAAAGQRLALYTPDSATPPTLTLGEGWRVYQLLIAAPEAPHRVALRADLVTPGATDPRELGVAVDWVHWVPTPRGPGALPGAMVEAALLVWALALVGASAMLVWPGACDKEQAQRVGSGYADSASIAARCGRSHGGVDQRPKTKDEGRAGRYFRRWSFVLGPKPGGHFAPLAVVGALGVALVVWAWRDLDGLTWLLPLAPGALAAATIVLAGVWTLAVGPRRWKRSNNFGATGQAVGAVTVLGLAHLALLAPLPEAWRGAAALVILWAPGWLAARALLGRDGDRAMGVVLGVAGALALQVCIALAAAALPWGASGPALLVLSNLGSAAALALGSWESGRRAADDNGEGAPLPIAERHPSERRGDLALILLVMLVAAALRLPALGAAELHDDEASVLIAAAELSRGDSAVLLRQLKGPDQIVLPAGPLALTGRISEQTARLPFALAGLATILGALAVARGPLGAGGAAAVAGLVLALDGLLIAFARIVQYQSVVMLMGVAAFWCCWRFAQGGPGGGRYLLAASVCVAVALLGHYDAVYVTPALALLVALGARRRRWGAAEAACGLAAPVLLGGGLLLAFYIPFVLHPHFAETVGHVQERTGQGGASWAGYNNLGVSYELLKVYNTPAQIWAVGGLLGIGLVGGLVVLAGSPCWVRDEGRRTKDQYRALPQLHAKTDESGKAAAVWATLVWLVAAGGAMSFLIAQPRTHIYVAVIPAALLAAVGARAIGAFGRAAGGALAAGGMLLALWAGLHQQVVFLRQSPEFVRSYPAALVAPLPGGGATLALDPAARFGFPARDGWKAVGELYRRGELRGAVASNQSSEVLAWYMRGQRRCGADPAVYLIALAAANPALPTGYVRTGAIQADGRDQILIYERGPTSGAPRVYALDDYVAAFDEQPVPAIVPAELACERPADP